MDYTHTARSVEDRLLSYRKDESGWKTCKKTVSVHQNCVIFYSRWSINTRCVLFLEWCCGVLETLLWIRGICVSIHLWITLWSWLCHRDVICADFSSGINTVVSQTPVHIALIWEISCAHTIRPYSACETHIHTHAVRERKINPKESKTCIALVMLGSKLSLHLGSALNTWICGKWKIAQLLIPEDLKICFMALTDDVCIMCLKINCFEIFSMFMACTDAASFIENLIHFLLVLIKIVLI